MRYIFLVISMLLLGWLKAARLHIPLAHESGSPDIKAPLDIASPAMATAIYGRLGPERRVDYFRFPVTKGSSLQAMLLIPIAAYENGLRAAVKICGPGLPVEGAQAAESEKLLTIIGRTYMLTRSYLEPLPESGQYVVALERLAGEGTYCFCFGDQEGEFIPEMMARVDAMMALDTSHI
ncbi:MAG TPA: hypothetical protein VH186_08060 [Chloroflexia bacterium]|nr:hypothetical protein [Chloroflexia bacterium]